MLETSTFIYSFTQGINLTTMIQIISRGVCFLVLFSLSQWASALSYTIEVPKQIIEDQISLHMPLVKKLPIGAIKLSEPKLNLLEDSNEVSVFLHVDVILLKDFKGRGRGEIVGTIDYRSEEGAFYLVNPKVVNLKIDMMPSFFMPQLSQAAQLLLEKSMSKYPVYRLDETDAKQKMAKASLRKVSVLDDRVLLTLGLPN
jgi:hypothetical protein